MVSCIYLKWSHPIYTTAPLKLHHRRSLSGAQMTFSSSAKANRRWKCSWVQINHKQFCPHPAAYLRIHQAKTSIVESNIVQTSWKRLCIQSVFGSKQNSALNISDTICPSFIFFIVSVSKDFKYLTQKHFIHTAFEQNKKKTYCLWHKVLSKILAMLHCAQWDPVFTVKAVLLPFANQ